MQPVGHYLEALKGYLDVSRDVSQFSGHWRPSVIINMLVSRLVYDKGPAPYWLFNFEFKKHSEWDQYLTKGQMERMQFALNPKSARNLVDDKLRFYERCLSRGIATPRVLAAIAVTGSLYAPPNVPVLTTPGELMDRILEQGDGKLALKTVTGYYGEHFLTIIVDKGKLFDHQGNSLSAASVMDHCRKSGTDFLIQEHLRLSDALKMVMPGQALGTIRVITIRLGEDVVAAYSFIKIPVPGNLTDNFHSGQTGNLIAGIDVANGTMMSAWGVAMKKGKGLTRIETHPDTGIRFSGTPFPFWDRILDTARQAARAFDELVTVGWDIAVTDRGINVIEGNWRYDVDVLQITLSRGLRSEMEALYKSAGVQSLGR
jgi:hypothetical protein